MFGKITSLLRRLADGPSRTAADDMRELRLRTMGDKAQIERLVAYELKRSPGISRDEGVRRANERLSRDLAR